MRPAAVRLLPLVLIVVAWLDVFTHEPGQNPAVTTGVYQEGLARERLAMTPQPELGGARAMLAPATALKLTQIALGDAKTNFLAKRASYCADVNLLDAAPKVDGFFSLTPRHFDALLSLIYNATNGSWSHLEDFMGVSQITAPENMLQWQPRTTALPLITAGQKPVVLDDTNTLWTFGRNDFDPARQIFLPPETRSLVSVAKETTAKVLNPKFSNQAVDFEKAADAPCLAVVAQAYYHDWRAEIDGEPAPLLRANVAFQAVQVPAGTHRIHLFYRDRAFEIGAAISVCMWINCFVGWLALRRRSAQSGNNSVPPRMVTDGRG